MTLDSIDDRWIPGDDHPSIEFNLFHQNLITEIKVTAIEENKGLVGFASLVFAGCFHLSSIGIFTKRCGGYRLTYPTRNNQNGTFHIFHPINKVIGDQIEQAIITKFEELIDKKNKV